jgi:hypothetical protein
MNANHVENLYTAPLPQSQRERWEMVTGLIDHLVASPGKNEPSIVARTIADTQNGSYAVNEAMTRVGQLLDGIKGHRSVAAVPDFIKGKANALLESEAYHTLVLLHAATKPRAGQDHAASVVMQISGPNANASFWQQVPHTLPGQWKQTKTELSGNGLPVSGRIPVLPSVPDLKTPSVAYGYPAGAGKTGTPVAR